jgi:hypothetical protein
VRPAQQRREGRRVRALRRVGGQPRLDGLHQRARRGRREQPERRPRARHRRVEDLGDGRAVVRRGAGEHVVADRGERPHVGRGVRVAAGRHGGVDVLGRPVDLREPLPRDARDAEVGEQRHALAVNSTLDGVTSPCTRARACAAASAWASGRRR